MKTLEEVQQEIREVINETSCTETRLQKLREKGYNVNYSWVKGGMIGRTWYLKRKNIYRIQVGASEANGEYFKAYCIEISGKNINNIKSDKLSNYGFNENEQLKAKT